MPRQFDFTELAVDAPAMVFTNETLRTAVYRMAEKGLTRLLVVNPADATRLVGVIALHDLLRARTRHLDDEQRRERILPWELITTRASALPAATPGDT